MTSRLNLDTTSQFPLAIPTRSKAPAARLVLRGRDGLALKQWLIKTTKCTLGSDPECNLRCDLPGIAAYHVLIVVGARQTFLRALAPRLTRDGIAVNELLLTGESSSFEIAGHQFELTRQDATGQLPAPGTPQARMRFALSNPLETRTKSSSETAAKVIADGEHNDLLPAGSDPATPRWVARLVRDAVLPLETQLREVMQPIEALKAEVNREKRRRQAEEEQRRDLDNREPPKPEIDPETVQSVVREQVEAITARQAGAMDVITERISDVNHQLSSIERIVAAERDAQPAELESRVTEEIEAQSQSIQKLQEGFVAVASALSDLQASQRASAETEAEWKQDVQSKLDALQDAVENMRGQSAEVAELSDEERERFARELQQSQTAFDIALPISEEYASVEVAAQTVASEWDPAELTSVVDSDKVDVAPTAVPFVALTGQGQTPPKAVPQVDLSADEQALEAPSAPSEPFAGDDFWDQEAEIESIELYGPSEPSSANAATDQTTNSAAVAPDLAQEPVNNASSEPALPSSTERKTGADEWTINNASSPAAATTADDEVFPTLGDTSDVSNEGTDPFAGDATAPASEPPTPQQTQVVAEPSDWTDPDLAHDDASNDGVAHVAAESNALFGVDAAEASTEQGPPPQSQQPWEQSVEASAPAVEEIPVDTGASAASIAEEQASLPSWWDEREGEAAEQPSERAAAPVSNGEAAGFIDPEFATAADYASEAQPSIDDNFIPEATQPAEPKPNVESDLAATPDMEEFFGGGVSNEPEVDWVANDDAKNEETCESAPSSELTGTVFPTSEPQTDKSVSFHEEAGAEVLAAEQTATDEEVFPRVNEPALDEEPVSTAKDTSTSALELIDELTVATKAANDDLPAEYAQDTEEFPTIATVAPTTDTDTGNARNDAADEWARVKSGDESFPTIGSMTNREPSGIFSLNQTEPARAPSAQYDTPMQSTAAEPSDAFNLSPSTELAKAEVEGKTADFGEATADYQLAQELNSSEEEDESVEDYMRRLLARMRGEEEPESKKKREPSNPDLAISAPSKMIQEAQPEVEDSSRAPTADATELGSVDDAFDFRGTPESTDMNANNGLTPKQKRLLEEKEDESRNRVNRKNPPEQNGQLAAMRELANSTARTAIGKSTRRRVVSSFILKGTISAIGMAVALALITINGFALNIGLIATGAAVLVAAIWGWDAVTTLRHLKQVAPDATEASEE